MTAASAGLGACHDRAGHRFTPSVFTAGLEFCERCDGARWLPAGGGASDLGGQPAAASGRRW